MAKTTKATGPEARLPKGLRDIDAGELRTTGRMLDRIREVYERYGFEPLETPAIEYTDALGKFLPDQDRPNEGVFSFQDEDEQWLSLRYDLTAPLARYVAQNFQGLPKPFRRYAFGNVYRNEKPGPGRFRQFVQFDADTVGAESVAADAEMCMLAADTLEALGLGGKYVIKVSNRKVLDGIREAIGLGGAEDDARWLTVMRAIDKADKFGWGDVALLLGEGRRDSSGDFTAGARLSEEQIDRVLSFVSAGIGIGRLELNEVPYGESGRFQPIHGNPADPDDGHYWVEVRNDRTLYQLEQRFADSELALRGILELRQIHELVSAAGYKDAQICIDPSVVRGLEYYTGPVFEAELTFQVKNDDGETVRFGSVGGGGRYDDLVARFTGERVPATGFSIGVSRLAAALRALEKTEQQTADGPVVVLVMDKAELAQYQRLTQTLRQAGIRAEMYLGSSGMKAQMKYADKRAAPCVVIQGSDERAKGEVTIKDLIEGAKAAAAIKDNKEWKEARPAQITVAEAEMVARVQEIIARHRP